MPSHKEFYDAISNISVNADTLNLNTDQVESKLDTATGLLTTLSADTAIIKGDMADGVAVSAASLPLPSGAATSALQTTANTSLSNLDTDLGALADSAATTDTGSFSLISLFKRLLSTKLPNSSGGRVPVDGSGVTQPVSGTVTANVIGYDSSNDAYPQLPVGMATDGYGSSDNVVKALIGIENGSVNASNPLPVTVGNDIIIKSPSGDQFGDVPFPVNANLWGYDFANDEQKKLKCDEGANLLVAPANLYGLPVTDKGGTGQNTVTTFTSTTSATLAFSNATRKLLTIFNEGAGDLYVLYGSGTATTSNYSVRVSSGDYLEIDKYTGQVNAIFASAGNARVTEIT